MDSSLDKSALRQQMRIIRAALSSEERQAKSQKIAARAVTLADYIDSTVIAAYYPTSTEVDCRPIFAHALNRSKKIYLPMVTRHGLNNVLLFGPYSPEHDKDLHKSSLGILEPPFDSKTALSAADLSVVFVPLLAFNTAGYRLGTGGGYYDVTFQWLKEARLKKQTSCVLVGLGFDCQETQKLRHDDWDIPLNYVVTESRTISCSAK
jgi:5-formyltetrahydrofolate cyclo-ligase